MNASLARNALLGCALGAGLAGSPARADVFTFNPSGATPGIPTASFSADTIQFRNYIRTTNVTNLTTRKQSFSGDQLQPITGFTLGGSAVTPAGFNSAYGLYFRITPAGSFPVSATGSIIGPATYTQLDVRLLADVGNDNGAVVDNAAGIGFANAGNTANDIVLATGSLISSQLSTLSDGSRRAHYVLTFEAAPGEGGFFTGSVFPTVLDEQLATPAAALSIVPIDSTTVLSIANGDLGSGGVAQLVPEPASLALMGAGLFALVGSRRRAGVARAA